MRRILVVDDEEKIRAIIRKYGEFEGYDITEAKDGMEAVKLPSTSPANAAWSLERLIEEWKKIRR